jgi:hypothetical protein
LIHVAVEFWVKVIVGSNYSHAHKYVKTLFHAAMCKQTLQIYEYYLLLRTGPGSSVGIATGYGLDDPGIESRWGARLFAYVQTGPGPTQPPVQWVPDISRG